MIDLLRLVNSYGAPVSSSPVVAEESGWPLFGALHLQRTPGSITFLVCANTNSALRVFEDLQVYLGQETVQYFPQLESLPFERVSPPRDLVGQRIKVLESLRKARSKESGTVVVMTVRALMQRLFDFNTSSLGKTLRVGNNIDLDALERSLYQLGYVREYVVETKGQFAVRGSIVDFFPPSFDLPVRVDLFGDEIEEIFEFDPEDQRRIGSLASVDLLPARECLIDDAVRVKAEVAAKEIPEGRSYFERIASGEYFDGVESWLYWLSSSEKTVASLLGDEDQVVLFEAGRLRGRANDLIEEELVLKKAISTSWGLDSGIDLPRFHVGLDDVLGSSDARLFLVEPALGQEKVVRSWGLSGRESEDLVRKIKDLLHQRYLVVVGVESPGSAEAIVSSFVEHEVDATLAESGWDPKAAQGHKVVVFSGAPLYQGAISSLSKVAVLSESDLSGRRRSHRHEATRRKQAVAKVDFEALEPGSYVVHDNHGIAIYRGMTKRTLAGAERDYLILEFKGSDKIYVPTEQISLITPYFGGERPTLSRLGGSDWQVTKAKARKAAQEVAQELVVLYQKRTVSEGHSFSADSIWQREVEERFPYELTRDQQRAISEVKADMESPKPMDRLVCGDVGFGKTEIAIRAAFKAIQDSKQVAMLVPTTLIAQQHYQTFLDRFEGKPVNVAMLSRFLTSKEARDVVKGLRDGSVDLVIGTHRLLAKDLQFKDLGLLIVDEEQRFGVNHKEQIKQLKSGVDVLTLTATPIPRTLEMSLTGIRDLSLLRTPPRRRQPILTHVGPYDEFAVSEAIRRELIREGQVFFVHNRVRDIESVAQRLRELVPEARVAVAHGQMDEGHLEQVVIDFWEGLYDVLVCTTIIESGIDMPTVNTLVVDRADTLGLGQLHQIRGRVGRSGVRAYAYLFYPDSERITDLAFDRLKTISENVELGSGYRIAMRDLEIRGAGNLLGESQSGHMAAVGYDLYVKMVKEAVADLNGEVQREHNPLPSVDIPVKAYIPEDYVERQDLRLDFYSRLSKASSLFDVDEMEAELKDRFGVLPVAVENLLRIVRLQVRLAERSVSTLSVLKRPGAVNYELRVSPVSIPRSRIVRLRRLYRSAVVREGQGELVVPVSNQIPLLEAVEQFCSEIIFDESSTTAAIETI
jgi:transcription-repair coupling factor (superfamily II helicase)